MPSKYRIILEMASQTARDIASNADRYTDFLITAANNYKYSFKEQLLIHAQKPDATACAEIDTWNKLGRWVNKGTKGIALLIDRDVPYKLRHVFDISDTNSRAGRNITLWQMKPEYEYAVSESLQASFGDVEEPRDFPHLLIDISGYAVEDPLTPAATRFTGSTSIPMQMQADSMFPVILISLFLKSLSSSMTLPAIRKTPPTSEMTLKKCRISSLRTSILRSSWKLKMTMRWTAIISSSRRKTS